MPLLTSNVIHKKVMEAFVLYLISLICLFGLVFLIWELKQSYSSYNWPTAIGKIIHSEIGSPKNIKTNYPYIYYKYTVNGKEHITRRLTMSLSHPTGKEILSDLLGKYPLGKEVEVKYHPIFHGHAVLEPGPKQLREYYVGIFVFALLLIVFSNSILYPKYNLLFKLISMVT